MSVRAAETPSLFTLQLQAEPCRCSRRVASIIERIDLGCTNNLTRFLFSLTDPQLMLNSVDHRYGDALTFEVVQPDGFCKAMVWNFKVSVKRCKV